MSDEDLDPRIAPTAIWRSRWPSVKEELVGFSVMDEMSAHLSTARHPYNVHVEVRARGDLDADRMRGAVSTALRRHPIARAQKVDHKALDRSFSWRIRSDPLDPLLVVDAGDGESMAHCRNQLLRLEPNLAQAPPLMVWLVRNPGGDALIFNLHQAAADGIGSLRFLRSVTRAYAGEEDETSEPDPLRVREQGLEFDLPEETALQKLKDLADMSQFVAGKAATVCEASPENQPGYCCTLMTLSDRELSELDHKRHVDGTFDDFLVAAMHRTVADWNRGQGVVADTIRLPVPVNLRPASWVLEVVGNYFMTFMTNTSRDDRDGPERLMKCIADQTRLAKERRFAEKIYLGMSQQMSVPVLPRKLIMRYAGNRQGTSAFVTNAGRIAPLSFGDGGEARSVWMSAPVQMPVGMGRGITSHAGELHLAFRYCRDLMDAQAGGRFAELYREKLYWLSEG